MQSGGDAQGVLEEILRPDLAIEVRAVPVVPFVQGHRDRGLLEAGDRLAVLAMGVGDALDLPRHLGHVAEQSGAEPTLEMLAHIVHGLGALAEHAFTPSADRADADQLDGGSLARMAWAKRLCFRV